MQHVKHLHIGEAQARLFPRPPQHSPGAADNFRLRNPIFGRLYRLLNPFLEAIEFGQLTPPKSLDGPQFIARPTRHFLCIPACFPQAVFDDLATGHKGVQKVLKIQLALNSIFGFACVTKNGFKSDVIAK